MKLNNLLFKNNFKNTTKNKIQFVSLILLVFLTSLVFSVTENSKTRVVKSYNQFISQNESNQHDFIVDFSNTSYVSDTSQEHKDNFSNINNLENRQNAMLDYSSNELHKKNSAYAFNYQRIEARTFYLGNNNQKILKALTLNPNQDTDRFIVTEGMPLSVWSRYQQAINRYSTRWLYLNQGFANNNNIKINDIIRLQNDNYGKSILVKNDVDISAYQHQDINQWLPNSQYNNANWFRVVGFGASADLVTPIIDSSHPIPDMKHQGLAYVDPILFGLEQKTIELVDGTKVSITDTNVNQKLVVSSSSDREVYYVGKFYHNKNPEPASAVINQIVNHDNYSEINLGSHFVKIGDTTHPLATYKSDNRYALAKRVTFIETSLKAFSLGSYLLIIITLALSFFALVLVLKKQVEKTRIQNGILRSLGYHKKNIILSYFTYPLMIALIGGIMGYAIGLVSQHLVMIFFQNYFNFIFEPFTFNLPSLLVCVFGIFILLSLVTAITCAIIMKKNPVAMINGDVLNNTFMIKQKIKQKLTFKNNFNSRFKAALLSNSIGKMIGVALTMMIVTALVAVATAVPIILQDNLTYSYIGNNYQTKIEYYSPTYNLPTSFYKTYDPCLTPWDIGENYYSKFKENGTNMTDDLHELMEQYKTGEINSETYSPVYNATDLTNLLYKNISKKYLKSNKITVAEAYKPLISTIISSAWSDYQTMGLANFNNKAAIEAIVGDYPLAKKHVKELDLLRRFYLKYRTTIGLDLQDKKYFSNKTTINIDGNPNDLFTQDDYLKKGLLAHNKLQDGHLKNENDIYTSFDKKITSDIGYNQIENLVYDIYNWYRVYFIDNVQQGFIQGIYDQVPGNLKPDLARKFQDRKADYNILFGVVPYNPKTDDLGTYFDANYQKQNFKVYGIKKDSKTQKLTNNSNDNLLQNLYQGPENGMIINASLAKKIGATVGQTITLNQYRNALYQNNKVVDLKSWNANQLTATDPDGSNTNSKYLYSSVSGTHKGEDIKWANNAISKSDSLVLKSNIDISQTPPVAPTVIEQQASAGSLIVNNEKITDNSNYVIRGITNQYGNSKAWVREDQAQKVTGYDQSKASLFQAFLKEWRQPFDKHNNTDATKQVDLLQKYQINLQPEAYLKQYQAFSTDPSMELWQKIFDNEYPIFNYKLSQADIIDDISQGISSSQVYGDYSVQGLVGGSDRTHHYNSYKTNSINDLLPIANAKAIMLQIYHIINQILLFAIITACCLGLLIIVLTSNIIISENSKIIATMKVLGYSNKLITKLVLGIYFPIVALTTIIGFGLGWGFLVLAMHILTQNSLVIPLIMKWWLPFISIIISYLIYSLAYLMNWKVMTKVNSLHVITDN